MSKSASLSTQPFDEFDSQASESVTPAWKQEVNQRLAAHRTRRGSSQDAANGPVTESPRTASSRAAEAAARVAARYAKAPSYSQLLAGEARAVVRAAGAAAEAARNAQAAAQAVLAGLESGFEPNQMKSDFWDQAEHDSAPGTHVPEANQPAAQTSPARWQDEPPAPVHQPARVAVQQNPWAGAQPRWEEALPVTSPAPVAGTKGDVWSEMRVHPNQDSSREYRQGHGPNYGSAYRQTTEEGELFPYNAFDPMGSATVEPVQHIPANLIEFPKELVATRKARPRLAEGPFYDASHESSQLSIFEVDPDLLPAPIYLNDTATGSVAPPEWASIELNHQPEPEYAAAYAGSAHASPVYGPRYTDHPSREQTYTEVHESVMLGVSADVIPVEAAKADNRNSEAANTTAKYEQESSASRAKVSSPAAELLVAPFSDRMLAAVVDGALVTLAFLAAAVVVIASTAHPPTGRSALIASSCGLLLFGLLYQFLFLSYAEEGTPGMRYARIALCTFDDDNPCREQMRKRIPALLLSALPAGLGLLWACFDGDHLGWHDRMTRTYQRKY